MSSSVCATLILDIGRRRWETGAAIAAVLACAVSPWLVREWAFGGQLAFSGVATGAAIVGVMQAGWLRSHRRIARVVCANAEEWHLLGADGTEVITLLHAQTRFFRHFLWLRFESRHCILLGPGDLGSDRFRQLQARVRRRPQPAVHERVA